MSQNGLVTLDLHVKQQIVEVHQLLLERILEENMVTRHRYQVVGGILLVEVFIHTVLGTQAQIDIQPLVGDCVLEFKEGVHQTLASVLERDSRHMGREDNVTNTHFLLGTQHLQRLLDRLRAMIHTWQDVAMYISMIEELYLLLLGLKNIAKEAHIIVL